MKSNRKTNMRIFMKAFVAALTIIASCLVMASPAYTIEPSAVYAGSLPGLPEEFKNYRWYQFLTKNFEILSIDREQGAALASYVESLKTWTNRRWGLQDIQYDRQCMILC